MVGLTIGFPLRRVFSRPASCFLSAISCSRVKLSISSSFPSGSRRGIGPGLSSGREGSVRRRGETSGDLGPNLRDSWPLSRNPVAMSAPCLPCGEGESRNFCQTLEISWPLLLWANSTFSTLAPISSTASNSSLLCFWRRSSIDSKPNSIRRKVWLMSDHISLPRPLSFGVESRRKVSPCCSSFPISSPSVSGSWWTSCRLAILFTFQIAKTSSFAGMNLLAFGDPPSCHQCNARRMYKAEQNPRVSKNTLITARTLQAPATQRSLRHEATANTQGLQKKAKQ